MKPRIRLIASSILVVAAVVALKAFVVAQSINPPPACGTTWQTNGPAPPVAPANEIVYSIAIDPVVTSTVYAGTTDGVFKSTDSGANWAAASTNLPTDTGTYRTVLSLAHDPQAVTPGIVYAGIDVGNGGTQLFRSPDGGATWNPTGLPASTSSVTAIALDPTPVADPATQRTVYAGTFSGVWKSTDGGATFTQLSLGNQFIDSLVVSPSAPNTLYAGTSSNGVYKSIDGGATWTQVSNGLPQPLTSYLGIRGLAVSPVDANTVYAATLGGGIYKTTDGGATWAAQNNGITDLTTDTVAIDPRNPLTIYAGAQNRGVFKSTDAGATWAEFNNGLTNRNVQSFAIDPLITSALYAGTSGDGVFRIVPCPATCASPPANMISWWQGENNTTDIISGNNGTWIGTPSYAPGEVGNAFSFDGLSQYVSMGNPASLQLTTQVTIDGWIYPTAYKNDVVYFGKTAYGDNEYVLIFQFNELTGMIQENIIGSSFVPPLNQWTHIALSYDGTIAKLYANGVVISSAVFSRTMSTGAEFFIGGRRVDPFRGPQYFDFPGRADEVEVFSRALSDAEIFSIFAAGNTGKCTPQPADLCANVTCTASDQCHDVGVCDPATGMCSNPPKANGSACNDGNACTQTDTCQNGVCTGSNPVTCSAADQCHAAGTCDPQTGVCSNPAKPDGTACDDGNACTQTDTCQSGTCVGSNPVTCTASDQCHDAGVCDPSTGACSNPAKANGTACNDGNACTTNDICTNGVCAGTPKTCAASDQCHDAGTCDPSTGACTNPPKANGTACNDGNACTTNDVCTGGVCGGTPKTCVARDQCHDAGTCDPSSGLCSNPPKANGTACNDGNACTTNDVCTNGTCGGTPKTCTASDQCHDAGTCDPSTGLCSNPAKPNGTACNDGNACTTNDVCTNGTCGGTLKTCTASDQCHNAGTCDPSTGLCSNPPKPNGTACNDGNLCTTNDTCQSGVCQGAAVNTDDGDPCTTDMCSPSTGGVSHTPVPGCGVASGSFVIGDVNAVIGQHVYFWGAQWARMNTLSQGPAPSSFKGFANMPTPTPANCGGTWKSNPGNSSGPPPAVPSFITVIAASSSTQSGSVITGNNVRLVVVKTDPGYDSNPGHPGTGTVVAVGCP